MQHQDKFTAGKILIILLCALNTAAFTPGESAQPQPQPSPGRGAAESLAAPGFDVERMRRLLAAAS